MASLLAVVSALLAILIVYFFTKLYNARKLIWERREMGLPIAPGHNLFFGHLLYLKSVLDARPKLLWFHCALSDIFRDEFNDEQIFYLDMWPIMGLFLVTASPAYANQATQMTSSAIEKPPVLQDFFQPIAGGPNLFTLPVPEWRHWRGVFNKGFSAEYTLSLIPGVTEVTKVFCNSLREHARKADVFLLDPLTLRFMMDLIGKTSLNTDLGAQRGPNVLADSMLSQIELHADSQTNPLEFVNVYKKCMRWWNARNMDAYVSRELDKRFAELKADPTNKVTKAVIDLILRPYLPGEGGGKGINNGVLDPAFRSFAIHQIRLFLFAGHDSTASTIIYVFHLLSQYPEALAKIRQEHDKVLGASTSHYSDTARRLASEPALANMLPYTLAVTKETLRLFPPAAGIRAGQSGVSLTSESGDRSYPTKDAMILINHVGTQRSSRNWACADKFLPERWLVPPGHDLYPRKGAWRPFENGPRNCVAQGMVMTQVCAILAMLARSFDIKPAYEEIDRLHPGKARPWRGERCYQVEGGSAHPVDQYPCRVFWRGGSE